MSVEVGKARTALGERKRPVVAPVNPKPSETAAFADVTERPFAMAFGGGVDIQMLHVGADLMRVRHHENYSPWTWRVAAGVMLPAR